MRTRSAVHSAIVVVFFLLVFVKINASIEHTARSTFQALRLTNKFSSVFKKKIMSFLHA